MRFSCPHSGIQTGIWGFNERGWLLSDVHSYMDPHRDLGYMDITVELGKMSAGKSVVKPQKTRLGIRILL